ncbi:DUF5590 domain-containing protein [Paenibacillus contaminans]|uniref:Cell wall elongation regulator TseB-like domain-containing protein n=1 Tax=Paenibacillus contaminans TaxID=450362 RepID=A0A329MET5_9BACL|nr:DUF5590 domain-containing protein [Paenibacillus contaminans]RAV18481.1 hypothetical protein DQG23_24570 [Paenibacillus contaminans]
MRRRTKITIGSVVAAALLLYGGAAWYQNVQAGEWERENEAVNIAYEQTILAKATRTEQFVGDRPYTIVHGQDKVGQEVIVWVSETEVHSEYTANGVTKEDIQKALESKDSTIEMLRISPGKLDSDFVWEAFYKKEEDGKTHYFYDFYRFRDGAFIDTWKLSLK